MRVPAALVTIPLLVGVVAGLVAADLAVPDVPANAAAAASLALIAAFGGFSLSDTASTVFAATIGCALAGASLASSSSRDTYRPPLLRWFDARARDDAVVVEGVLREDASWSGAAASLVVDVDVIRGSPAAGDGDSMRTAGGVRVSVGGALAPARLGQWRAGRRIRAPVFLRLPPVYRDPGV